MVDVSGKDLTLRSATAEARIEFPQAAWTQLRESGFSSRKGPVLDVARVAGTMAVKQTSLLIPFCHPLPVESCSFEMEPSGNEPFIRIACTVTCRAKTGVEMEALTGASVAALTIYDMTKSLGLGIRVRDLHLVAKSGGKSDYAAAQ